MADEIIKKPVTEVGKVTYSNGVVLGVQSGKAVTYGVNESSGLVTYDKVLLKSEKISNNNLVFGKVSQGDSNVVSGGVVYNYLLQYTTAENQKKIDDKQSKDIEDLIKSDFVKKAEVKSVLDESTTLPVNSKAVIDKGYVEQKNVLSVLDNSKKDPINTQAVFRDIENTRIILDSIGDNVDFVSTWDTTKTSEGSSDAFSVIIPLRGSGMGVEVDWGDNSSGLINYGIDILEAPEDDNLVTEKRLKEIGFSKIKYNEFSGNINQNNIYNRTIIPTGVYNDLYIKYEASVGNTNTRLRVVHTDNTTVEVNPGVDYKTTKEVRSIVFTFGVSGEINIRNLIVSKKNVKFKPAFVDSTSKHTYINSGVYNITIKNRVSNFTFRNSGDRLKLINIVNWGGFYINSYGALNGCENLNLSSTIGVLKTIGLTSLQQAFSRCKNITEFRNLGKINMSNATNVDDMFYLCDKFNGNGLSGLDFSKVESAVRFCGGNNSITPKNLDDFYKSLSRQDLKNDVILNMGTAKYTTDYYKNILINKYNWIISDGGKL